MKWKMILADELQKLGKERRKYIHFRFEGAPPPFASKEWEQRKEYSNFVDSMIKHCSWSIDRINEWIRSDADELDDIMTRHLCDTCTREYPYCLAGVMFGLGAYSDNVIACKRYLQEMTK